MAFILLSNLWKGGRQAGTGNEKSEIRISKSETNSKFQFKMCQTATEQRGRNQRGE
jgi:hypothetical protein